MRKKSGFVFVETIVVTVVVLASLMVVYSLYVSSMVSETRRLRYDDVSKLYETYYIKKYLESFDLDYLKAKINEGSPYEMIYRSRSDIFGTYYREEGKFFEHLWSELGINNIYIVSHKISNILECSSGLSAICSNKNLLNYLRTLDEGAENTYYLIVEYATAMNGGTCTPSDCFYFYGNIVVGEQNE